MILDKYSDFVDVFSEEKALVLPEQTDLNKHAIKLEDGVLILFDKKSDSSFCLCVDY